MEVYIVDYRLPYYMAYPLPLQYDDERAERMDFEYLKSMYPDLAKQMLPFVEEECERMAYAGSVIYDEYPDQLQIRMMCNRIYDKVKDLDEDAKDYMKDMVQLMVYHELYKARCEHRRNRRNFYLS